MCQGYVKHKNQEHEIMIKSTLNSTEIDSSSTLTRLSKIKEGQYLILNTDKPRPARILDLFHSCVSIMVRMVLKYFLYDGVSM